MGNSCVYIPKVGASLMGNLRKQFDYPTSRKIFLIATNPKFIEEYRHSLELDSEGVPTVETVLKNAYIKNKIGTETMLNSLNKDKKVLDDTIENYEALLQEAYTFNMQNPNKDEYVANVIYTEDGKLKVEISTLTKDRLDTFKRDYKQFQLNKRLADLFSSIGITIGELSKVERESGVVGVTDFTVADQIAEDSVSMIRVANNREGAKAISEEFSHLIIGAMNDNSFIQRALKLLKSNQDIIMDVLGENYQNYKDNYNGDIDLLAEEALGHILQAHLIDSDNMNYGKSNNFFSRVMDNIRNKFKKFNENDVLNALQEVNKLMSTIANDVLNNTLPINKEQIAENRRQTKLNALSDRIARNQKILKHLRDIEVKRFRIVESKEEKEEAESNFSLVDLPESASELETILALTNYANNAVNKLKIINADLSVSVTSEGRPYLLPKLRKAKSFIDSYGKFIDNVLSAIEYDKRDDTSLWHGEPEDEAIVKPLMEVIRDLAAESRALGERVTNLALPSFCAFLKPFLGDEIISKIKDSKGNALTLEQLFTSTDSDISFLDLWLDAMGDSADVALQIFDRVVKTQKDKVKAKTIDDIRRIVALRQKAEKYGITSFEWMFEKDNNGNFSGDYIDRTHYAEFWRQYRELNKELNEKYGRNATGENATKKVAERQAWLKENAESIYGKPKPKKGKWINDAYDRLSADQKEILKDFLDIKNDFDAQLPEQKVDLRKAIQIRKAFSQRLIDSGMNPSSILENIKENFTSTFLDRIDDDQIFGKSSRSSLTDFNGHEYMVLPVLYTQRLENPNDISTDVFSTLMQYAYMSNNYTAMEEIVDPLEIGKYIMSQREVKKTRGNLPVVENIKTRIGSATNIVFDDSSNIVKKLNEFMESQVYQRYLKDTGTFEILGKQVNKNKVGSYILQASSMAQLGFNWLANIANVMTGICMQNIEAAASEYFGAAELVKADVEYTKLLAEFIPELGSRFKQNKLALFDELIDFKGDFRSRLRDTQKKNWLQRIFGENIAFLGQDAGDHWLYNRTAIAMAMREKVIVPRIGEVSLWDALEIVDSEYGEGLKKMILPDGTTDLNGNKFRISQWSRQVLHVNQSLFGIYNEEDSNAANRIIVGRMLQQYRKWIKPQYNKRFQASQLNITSGKTEEGYYRTVFRIMNELARGTVQMGNVWNNLSSEEQANVKRAITELIQFLGVWALVNFANWGDVDKKKRPWALKLAEYISRRLYHELSGLAPSLPMAKEMLKNVKNPVPSVSVLIDMSNLLGSLIDPRDWVDEIQSGPYKGKSTLQKNFYKSPIRVVRQFHQVEKFIDDIDTSIEYYAKPY